MRARTLILILLIAALVLSLFPATYAENDAKPVSVDMEKLLAEMKTLENNGYDVYYNGTDKIPGIKNVPRATAPLEVAPGKTLLVTTAKGSDIVTFSAPKDGLYWLTFTYQAQQMFDQDGSPIDGTNDIVTGFRLDGKLPFAECDNLGLARRFVAGGPIKQDRFGNDIDPGSREDRAAQDYTFVDRQALHLEPFLIFISAGSHTLNFTAATGDVSIKNIVLAAPAALPSYEAYKTQHPGQLADTEALVIEAESAQFNNSIFIGPGNDLSSPYTTPYSASLLRLNCYGGTNWNLPHTSASWMITVPKTGYYTLSLRYQQNINQGVASHRALLIDGQVPFREASDIEFAYVDGWAVLNFKYPLFLNKTENGQKTTLTLDSILGSSAAVVVKLRKIVLDLNNIYQSIVKITTPRPDPYRDYHLDKTIPNLIPDLKRIKTDIDKAVDLISVTKSGQNISQTLRLAQQVQEMYERPDLISKGGRLDALKSSISTVGVTINNFQTQPLLLDKFMLRGTGSAFLKGSASLGDELVHRFNRFIASFSQSSSDITTSKGQRTIRVWLDAGVTGREQYQVLSEMIASDFTPKTGIGVQLELVAGAVMEAKLAGQGPDIALNQGDVQPVNFAMRGILYNLAKFKDFQDIRKNFVPAAFTPYTYEDGIYGIPERMDFTMMFYRTDIFAKLGLQPPQTWEELLSKTLPTLNKDNKQVGIGPLAAVATQTAPNMTANIFTNLLLQRGGQLYSPDLKTTALNTPLATDAFITAANYYTQYMMPQQYDEMSRFRTGEMPLLIGNYTLYNVFAITIPELQGLWKMVPIPGTPRPDEGKDAAGNPVIDRSQLVGGMASVMFNTIKDPEAGWEFLKWWTNADVQARFGVRQEAILGPSGRYNTANINAFSKLPWDPAQVVEIKKQLEWAKTAPQVPGSYYYPRAISSAFTQTVLNLKDPREMLITWNEQINNELARKSREFDFQPQKSLFLKDLYKGGAG